MEAEPEALLKRIAADTAALLDCIEHVSGSGLAPLVAGMQQQANTWSYAQGRLDRRVEQTGVYAEDGYRAAASWIAFHSNLRRGVVKVRGRHARHLESMPAADRAARAGWLHEDHLRLLTRCPEVAPELFDTETEAAFAAVAVNGTLKDLATVTSTWIERAEHERSPDPADQPAPETNPGCNPRSVSTACSTAPSNCAAPTRNWSPA